MPDNLEIRNIRTDGGTQPRAGLDDKTVADYAEDVKNGTTFPPVVVFHDGSNHWLADGFHRLTAYRVAGKQRIPAEVKAGTLRDAQLYSVGANATHGLRRSRDDKRRAVLMMLEDAEWGELGNREIARYCKVSHTFVANLREETGNVASNGDGGKGGNVASNGDGGKGGNVASEELTAVLRRYLESEYKTTEPASLAVLARALSVRLEYCVTIQSKLRLFKDGPYGVQAGLIALAQELQSYVPQHANGNGQNVGIPALVELIDAIKRLTPQAADQVRQWCDGISVDQNAKEHAPVWEAMEKLICALRPN